MSRRTVTGLGLSVALIGALVAPAAATSHADIVTPDDDRWQLVSDHYNEDGTLVTPTDGEGGITQAPAPGPWGADAFELTIPAGQKAQAATDLFDGITLDRLDRVGYSTYIASAWLEGYGPSINVVIDPEGPDDYATLVWEANKAGHAIEHGQWQTWDTTSADSGQAGGWWSPSIQPFSSPDPGSNANPAQLDALVDEFGGGSEIIGLAVNVGRHGAMTSYVDGVAVTVDGATSTFDFETTAPTKDDCKKGGWQELEFRNQGQCVSHFASAGRRGGR